MLQSVWVFLIYAFLGWCSEVVFAALNTGKFVNRGFCNGPICPIYGFGMHFVSLCLMPFRDNLPLLFILSLLLTSFIEFITGFVLEKFFNQKWWDYSKMPFNIKGYVCLKFSVLWGLACVFIIRLVHPFILKLIGILPRWLSLTGALFFGAVLAADFVITIINLMKLPRRLRAIEELEEILNGVSENIGTELSEKTNVLKERNENAKAAAENAKKRLEELYAGHNMVHRRIFKAFPNIQHGKHEKIIKTLMRNKNAKK